MTNIVFIGGPGRSGTNIMKEILSMHPEVGSHDFEYRFIIDPDGIIDYYINAIKCWSPYNIDKKLHRLETFLMTLAERGNKNIYVDWELNKHIPNYKSECFNLIDDLIDFKFDGYHYGMDKIRDIYFMKYKSPHELQLILGNFIRKIIDGYLLSVNKTIYVEDNTHNILFAKEILEILPEAKIIHMKREPKDVVSSLSKQRWAPSNKKQAAYWYKSIMNKWDDVKKEICKESFLEVDLYDLIENTAYVLKIICDFIGVSFTSKLLNYDLSKSHKFRWKNDFTEDEYNEIQKILK